MPVFTLLRKHAAQCYDEEVAVPQHRNIVAFFTDAGLEAATVNGGVKVTRVIHKQPPHMAGLRAGAADRLR